MITGAKWLILAGLTVLQVSGKFIIINTLITDVRLKDIVDFFVSTLKN